MPDESTAFRPPEETPTVIVGDREARALQLTPGTLLGDRYRIVSLIGQGGMGEVYRADDLKLGQPVALKFLARHGEAERLYEEVRIGRQVSHPNVCRLYDIAEIEGHLFITMEFVDGEDLASLLRRVGRLSAEKALAVTRDICAGVAAAHDKGVIHRDLKPANVMIDGRGRARVTDFGLALAGGSASDGAGTPAYMAPEQLAGEPASIKSDIYALGLVLYEVFTGRRTFEATSTLDLLARQQRAEFTRPSLVTKDVPAAVERAITRCLDPNPGARPDSVEDLMRELPGGDPLAAAVAAGETPSPAMVAAAADRGELPANVALTLLAIFVVSLFSFAALTNRTTLYRRVPVKSPEVLQERVETILAATNQKLTKADWSSSFGTDTEQLQWMARHRDASLEFSPLIFVHHQSPRPLIASNYEHRVVTNDPPLVYSGMADVLVDSAGRLVQFTIVPPQLDSAGRQPFDWTPVIALTGITARVSPATPRWAAPVDSDEKSAWTVADGTRIEAAAYHGRPVWFYVIPPWRTPSRMLERREDVASRISTAAVLIVAIAFWVAALSLAVRNLRRGQSDRRGARRLGWFTFAVGLIGFLLLAHHVADPWAEWERMWTAVALALLMGSITWIGYIAIEPLVRRRWPRMLIGVSRLVSGRVRDPMIGRDLLVGTTAGVIGLVLRQLTALTPGAAPLQAANLTLSGLRYVGWFAAGSLVLSIAGPLIAATVLVALNLLTRNLRLSIIAISLVAAAAMLGDVSGPLWARAAFGLCLSAVMVVTLFRFGLLAYSAATFSYILLRRVPITLDPSAWYFGRSILMLALFLAISIYSFIVSLGGKRWLPEFAIDA